MKVVLRLSDLPSRGSYAVLGNSTSGVARVASMLHDALRLVHPELRSGGTRQELADCGDVDHIISITPRAELDGDERVIMMPIDTNFWGYIPFLSLSGSHDLMTGFPEFSVDDWRKAVTLHGRRYDNPLRTRLTFVTNSYRVARLAQRGFGRFLPRIVKMDPFTTRRFRYGGDYRHEAKNYRLDDPVDVWRRLEDDRSRFIYRTLLDGPPSATWQIYFKNLLGFPQYMEHVQLDNAVVLNFGIADGFEIPGFLALGASKVFNVDPGGHRHLSDYARTWTEFYPDRLVAVERALDCEDRVVEVATDGAENHHIPGLAGEGVLIDGPVRCSTLESILADYDLTRIDLIKADIEGAERQLIDQLKPVVERYRPQLAICIYHSANDFVDMPRDLMSMCDNYAFYIGHYCYEQWETVLYCIPRERLKAGE